MVVRYRLPGFGSKGLGFGTNGRGLPLRLWTCRDKNDFVENGEQNTGLLGSKPKSCKHNRWNYGETPSAEHSD